ncbi:MAG: leucine--tRNA ligase [Campylobacterales bacterium]
MEYNPKEIEQKWQASWLQNGDFEPSGDLSKEKKYILSMFPYPSGRIHMGHVRNYCISDAIARDFRKQGYNVLHPIGWDAFGMPAENAAIKHSVHPKEWTYQNIENMKKELFALGLSFSQSREFATCDAEYTKWEQLFFIKMWENGLVYRKKGFLNWCPHDKTVLANEQVIEGRCWRCDTEIVQKEMYQYYLKITDYAQELLDDLKSLEGRWPKQVITMQENWIGRSEGLEFSFELCSESKDRLGGNFEKFSVFTTRADTIYGVSYTALAPEHEMVRYILQNSLLNSEDTSKIESMLKILPKDRAAQEKEGIYLGIDVIHPLTKQKVPVWVANFVLTDYGSGAVMAVPAHDERDFEFAKKYNLPIKKVITSPTEEDELYTGEGKLHDSAEFSGLSGKEAREAIIKHFETLGLGRGIVNFRLKDWGISRQRYWGAPIPMIECESCGVVPEDPKNLPVKLPEDVVISEGNPLEKHSAWREVECPKCGGKALRESDTMDTFVQSSWYFLRYTTPRELWDKSAFDKAYEEYFMDVDEYIGGIEHAILHLLYARFFTKVLRDLGFTKSSEPFSKLLTQGMVTKDGAKMSKSKGNVVDPDAIIEKYGADTARLFILFAAPPTKELEWNDSALEGAFRFIRRLVKGCENIYESSEIPNIDTSTLNKEQKEARKKVYEALLKSKEVFSSGGYAFNTLIAACMEALNALNAQKSKDVFTEGYYVLTSVLEPIIPHICWEISERYFMLSNQKSLEVDSEALKSDTITIAITVNGKKRAEIEVEPTSKKEQIIEVAKVEVSKWLEDKSVVKEIYVPNKLVNLVVK